MERSPCTGPAPLGGLSRREVLGRFGLGLGGMALAHILEPKAARAAAGPEGTGLHHAPRAKRVIYLFMSGGPSQLETFDPKPLLVERNGEPLPDGVRRGQRLTGMSGNQAILPLAGSVFGFSASIKVIGPPNHRSPRLWWRNSC